jgi:hypothetical protein
LLTRPCARAVLHAALLAAAWCSAATADSLHPVCRAAPGGGSATSAAPVLLATLFDRFHEAWLGSPAVADLDGDGTNEILAPRHDRLLGWHLDGSVVFSALTVDPGDRIWASPVVGDLVPWNPGLEVAAAARERLYLWNADGDLLPGFPVTWRDEIRAVAAGDVDADGALELVVVSTSVLQVGATRDVVMAFETTGAPVAGYPPNTSGTSGCTGICFPTGGYDQTLALGDVDGDGSDDVWAPHDNAYMSLHRGDGFMFDSAPEFEFPTKFGGIRWLLDLDEARQGYADDEATSNQAHFTNSAPALVDMDGDGLPELVVLSSVQNASQTDRLRGVALWAARTDGTRLPGWEAPHHVPAYLSGLWDLGGNIVGATNQPGVASLDPAAESLDFVFAGFDGKIHAVGSDRQPRWAQPYTYTTDASVLTGGVAIADLSGDGVPEIVFASYSTDLDESHLFVLGADGAGQHKLALPRRGAMPVPTIADVDRDGDLEIVVSLKDGEDRVRQLQVYTVPGSNAGCLPWPTGRGNWLRSGYVPEPDAASGGLVACALLAVLGARRARYSPASLAMSTSTRARNGTIGRCDAISGRPAGQPR